MLNLKCASNAGWAAAAAADLDTLLIDHLHAEKKAASTALSLISRYPERLLLVEHMVEHAREELEHFVLVLAHLKQRGVTPRRDVSDAYVNRLLARVRRDEPARLLDALIVAALIEARSCERFQLLVEVLPPGPERDLFSGLMPSEARHYTMFLTLAREYFPAAEVQARLEEFTYLEADIVSSLPDEPRMHG
jgi:tRNA 2-(methylsulfanyl)-N6-isopentenyladenosine37 hydroxylase